MKSEMEKSLLKHYFWGNIDTGVLQIFMGLYLWSFEKNPITVAIAFAIPIVVNIVGDYLFSTLSDKKGRKGYMLIGNIGSAIALSLMGVFNSITYIYLCIFIKAVFNKLYQTSIEPYEKELMSDNLQAFIAKKHVKVSSGASIGGFALMTLVALKFNMGQLIVICGLIELFSTVFLLPLKEVWCAKPIKSEGNNAKVLEFFSIYYGIMAFAFALFDTRLIIYFIENKGTDPSSLGLIFFIVFGLPSIFAGTIYTSFKKLGLKNMLVVSTVLQVILLFIIPYLDSIWVLMALWFIISLFEEVTHIYASSYYKSGLFDDIGKSMSKVRVVSTIALLFGQGLISFTWKSYSLETTFYLSSILLLANIVYIYIKGDNKELLYKESY